jgi:hypothetical protein
MKQARDFAAFRSVSAWIVLRADGTEIATVHAHHGDMRTTVTVYNYGPGNDTADPQTRNAGGIGYDRTTAAMAGLWIDGHMLTDHCDHRARIETPRGGWPRGSEAPPGFDFANWSRFDSDGNVSPFFPGEGLTRKEHFDRTTEGWASCYREPGLRVLKALGYRVIQAV